ncbi:thioredoxin family protein [Anaerohalosphaeraceae bacterium U12dextr]
MKSKSALLAIMTVVLISSSSVWAQQKAENPFKTVEEVYPGLTSGGLSLAVLTDLPEGILLKAGTVEMTSENISKIIDSQPEPVREELKKNAFFILEQEAAGRILLDLAKKAAVQPQVEIPKDENELIRQFFETAVFKNIEVTDAEIKTFYENNKDMCGGATFEQIKSSLKEYVLDQKKQQIASEYIRDLGKQIPIQVSESWVKQQAALAFDNPVDKARKSGKPSVVDFGASGCRPCDMMTPILETLAKKYEGKVNVLFVHVREQQILAARYGIQSIPVQVFFDQNGREVFRHTGFFAQDEIEKKFKEMGIQ